jgi:protoheme ferro-lyase
LTIEIEIFRSIMPKKAVLMMAYGTPNSVDRMHCYLSDIRGGRPMSEEFVAEFRHRYELIGGSPLTRLTYEQAKKTREVLQRRGYDWPVYLGMRHWSPWIKDAVGQMYLRIRSSGDCLAPHYSSLSIGRYRQNREAQQMHGTAIKFNMVKSGIASQIFRPWRITSGPDLRNSPRKCVIKSSWFSAPTACPPGCCKWAIPTTTN